MRGLELSEKYYKTYGEPMLKVDFPELYPRLSAGVFGQGSENFGFDDEVSLDHDIDPGFYIFLNAEDYQKYEFRLSRAYDSLPEEFQGVKIIGKSVYETSRHGVREISAFFSAFTGLGTLPETNRQWLSIPDFRLATALNGKIFYDGSGEVTAFRACLKNEPEDVRLKKLSKNLIFAAQSGQYNYTRALSHGEQGAAVLALSEFSKNICEAVYKLNFSFAPFYKWLFRGAKDLPVLSDAARLSESLLLDPLNEKNAQRIEEIAALIIKELKNQNLTDLNADFLEPHAYEVRSRISDPELRNTHIME